jgi:hypothetical protein
LSAAQLNTFTFSLQLLGAATTSHSNPTRSLRRQPHPQTLKMLSSLQNPRQAAAQLMNFGLILSTAFMVCSALVSSIAHRERRSIRLDVC